MKKHSYFYHDIKSWLSICASTWIVGDVELNYWREILLSRLPRDLMHVLGNFRQASTIFKVAVTTLRLIHASFAPITVNVTSRTRFHARVEHNPTTVIQNLSFFCICVISDTKRNGSISELIQWVKDVFLVQCFLAPLLWCWRFIKILIWKIRWLATFLNVIQQFNQASGGAREPFSPWKFQNFGYERPFIACSAIQRVVILILMHKLDTYGAKLTHSALSVTGNSTKVLWPFK